MLAGAIGSITRRSTWPTPTWDAAVTHYATLAAMIAVLGGLHWWATKVLGRPAERGARRGRRRSVLLLGTVLLAFPDIISALLGSPRRDSEARRARALNTVAAVGGGAGDPRRAGRRGQPARRGLRKPRRRGRPADPWEGQTLEWATASPPPLDNFAELPVVESAEPLLDQREEASA